MYSVVLKSTKYIFGHDVFFMYFFGGDIDYKPHLSNAVQCGLGYEMSTQNDFESNT